MFNNQKGTILHPKLPHHLLPPLESNLEQMDAHVTRAKDITFVPIALVTGTRQKEEEEEEAVLIEMVEWWKRRTQCRSSCRSTPNRYGSMEIYPPGGFQYHC